MAGGLQSGDVVRSREDITGGGGGLFSTGARYFVPSGSTGVITDCPWFGDVEVRWDTGLIVRVYRSKLDVIHRASARSWW